MVPGGVSLGKSRRDAIDDRLAGAQAEELTIPSVIGFIRIGRGEAQVLQDMILDDPGTEHVRIVRIHQLVGFLCHRAYVQAAITRLAGQLPGGRVADGSGRVEQDGRGERIAAIPGIGRIPAGTEGRRRR